MRVACLLGGFAALGLGVLGDEPILIGAALLSLAGATFDRRIAPSRLLRTARAVIGSITLLVIVVLVLGWFLSRPTRPDAFYSSGDGAQAKPGTLIRAEPFTRAVPPNARAWRILYHTTRAEGQATTAAAIVAAKIALPDGPRPVIAWTHGTTGAVPGCGPSVLAAPYPFDATLPAQQAIVDEGWVLVATDYAGLSTPGPHPYLIGEGEARSALDAVRAARQMPELQLEDRAIVWGHSQGGHAALWTAGLAPGYAPELRIAGVAALAPATLLVDLVEAAQSTPIGKMLVAFILRSYSAAYADVRASDYIRLRARALVHDMGGRCLAGIRTLFSVIEATRIEGTPFAQPPSSGPLSSRLAQNVPAQPIAAPMMVAQGERDELVLPRIQDRYVGMRCKAGQAIEYRKYQGRDHLSVVAADSPLVADLVAWTRDRLSGVAPTPGCSTVTR